jgi:hypothetical protein
MNIGQNVWQSQELIGVLQARHWRMTGGTAVFPVGFYKQLTILLLEPHTEFTIVGLNHHGYRHCGTATANQIQS